jgi:HNH endonuclease
MRPMFHWGVKSMTAARAAYLLFKGPIVGDLYVCHSCDNDSCVNPDHLWLGTHKDNMRDKKVKGRAKRQECKYGHPLTLDNVYVMKRGNSVGKRRCKTCVTVQWRKSVIERSKRRALARELRK